MKREKIIGVRMKKSILVITFLILLCGTMYSTNGITSHVSNENIQFNQLYIVIGVAYRLLNEHNLFQPFYSNVQFGGGNRSSVDQCQSNRRQAASEEAMPLLIIGAILIVFGFVYFTVKSYKTWVYRHGDSTIIVKNTPSTGELIINGILQDKKTAALSTEMTLSGKLDSGEDVSVHLGSGMFNVDCNLRVDNKLIQPNN